MLDTNLFGTGQLIHALNQKPTPVKKPEPTKPKVLQNAGPKVSALSEQSYNALNPNRPQNVDPMANMPEWARKGWGNSWQQYAPNAEIGLPQTDSFGNRPAQSQAPNQIQSQQTAPRTNETRQPAQATSSSVASPNATMLQSAAGGALGAPKQDAQLKNSISKIPSNKFGFNPRGQVPSQQFNIRGRYGF